MQASAITDVFLVVGLLQGTLPPAEVDFGRRHY